MKRAERALPWLLPLVALLPNLAAALPLRTYYFRDLEVSFAPLRLFFARELREGRWPTWNPYLHEGTFAIPVSYPPDLLLALHPSLEWFSWLLTLHLPLAALAAYALARELGQSRAGAFLAGGVYSLGGYALSSLNLYVFLQALALAPLVMLTLRRAARGDRRSVALAGLTLAAAISTLAMEFVAQALALAALLALEARRDRPSQLRALGALGLGAALAALPIALVLGLLPETQRGAGFEQATAVAQALHPVALAQVLVAGLFGDLEAGPGEVFWGGRFFSRSFPYFLSLYLGPAVVALAGVGALALPRGRRLLLLLPAGLALWFALGEWGGLAPTLLSLPGFRAFRFPSKAFLTVHLVCALLAGFGLEALRARPWPRAAGVVSGVLTAGLAALASVAFVWPDRVASFFALTLPDATPLASAVGLELLRSAAVAAALALLALLVSRGFVAAPLAAGAALVVAILDLARAGAGLNPQVAASVLALPPELAERLGALEGQRLFSYELEHSPSARAFLAKGGRGLRLSAAVAYRRLLNPYTNMLDRVETAWGKDLTSFGGAAPELAPEEYEPGRIGGIVARLRQAAVSRVVSLDPLSHDALAPIAEAAAGPAGLRIRLYALRDTLPRAYVACRVVTVRGPGEAFQAAVGEGFDGRRDVALEVPAVATCSSGQVTRLSFVPGSEAYEVASDGAGFLVMRDGYARGWAATRDGAPVPVLRANGKYRAVPLQPGPQRVELRYHAPGRRLGLAVSTLALLVGCAMLLLPRRAKPLG